MATKKIWLFAIGLILFCGCHSQNTREGIPAYHVSFCVIPQTVPDTATVYITGTITSLGNWDPAVAPMSKKPDGSWTKSLVLPQDLILEYRFDLGDVLSEAVGADSLPLGSMFVTVKKDTEIVVHVANWKDALLRPDEKSSPAYQAERFFRKAQYFRVKADYGTNADSARLCYRKAMALFRQQRNWERLVSCNCGIAALTDDVVDQRLQYYNRALTLAEKHLGKDHDETGIVTKLLAGHYSDFGDYDRAQELAQRALNIHLANHGEVHRHVFGDLRLIGSIYRKLGKYDEAIAYRQRALKIISKLWGSTHQEVGNSYKALGGVYADLGEFDKAIELYERAREIHAFYNDEISVTTHMSYFELGKIYMLAGDYEQAKDYFEKALKIRQTMYGKYHGHIVWAHYSIAKACFMERDCENAVKHLRKALELSFPGFDGSGIYGNPPIENVSRFRPSVFDILDLKGKVLQGMALQHKGSLFGNSKAVIKDLETALDCYDNALQLANIGLEGILTTNAKLHLQTKLTDVVEQAIYSAKQLYDISANRAYLEKAFEFSERGKSVLLRLALQQSEAKSFAGIDDEILQEEKELTQQIVALDISIAKEKEQKERDKEKIVELEAVYHQLKSQHEFLMADLEKNYPRYYALKHQIAVSRVSELQDALHSNAAILDYFVGDTSIYAFVITKEDFELVPLPKAEELDSLVTMYTGSIRRIIDAESYLKSATQLYDYLIRPVESRITHYRKLIIIPDGLSYYVPFGALLTSTPSSHENDIDFSNLDYLLNHHEISYHYSATLYQRSLNGRDAPQPKRQLLAMAPVFAVDSHNSHILAGNKIAFHGLDESEKNEFVTRDGNSFQELRNSETEARTIVDLFERQGSIGFFHKEASEENFKANAGKFRYVHISTHGFMNEKYPQLSGLAFSQPDDTTSGEDGILYSGELYTLNLNADLVVLSSCESGIGKLAKGEGMLSLTRGFLYAGANNVMVSLWKVYDKQTSKLMIEFYRGVAAGEDYSTALRNAKLMMMKNEDTAFPISWAGFVLVGE